MKISLKDGPPYGTKVKVSSIDEEGIKEVFDDFIGEFVGVSLNPRYGREIEWKVSNGTIIWTVHPFQVEIL